MTTTPLTVKDIHKKMQALPPSTITNIAAKQYQHYEVFYKRSADGSVEQANNKLASSEYSDTNVLTFEGGSSTAQEVLESLTELMEHYADSVVLLEKSLVASTQYKPAKIALKTVSGSLINISNGWVKHADTFGLVRTLGLKEATTILALLSEKLDRTCKGTLGVYLVGDKTYFSNAELIKDYPELCPESDWLDLFQLTSEATGSALSVKVYRCKVDKAIMETHFGHQESLVSKVIKLSLCKDAEEKK